MWTPCTQLQTWHLLHSHTNIKRWTFNNEIFILLEWYIVTIDLYPEKVMLIFFNFIRFHEIVPEESIANSSCQTGHNSSLCSNSELHEEYWCRHVASVFILICTVQASQREACKSNWHKWSFLWLSCQPCRMRFIWINSCQWCWVCNHLVAVFKSNHNSKSCSQWLAVRTSSQSEPPLFISTTAV